MIKKIKDYFSKRKVNNLEVTSVQSLSLKPGDVLLVTVPKHFTNDHCYDMAKRIKEQLFPPRPDKEGIKVVVIQDVYKFSTINIEE